MSPPHILEDVMIGELWDEGNPEPVDDDIDDDLDPLDDELADEPEGGDDIETWQAIRRYFPHEPKLGE
jgi:hypothetical protein